MSVLVDSSVWIDYFRGDGNSDIVDHLVDANLITTNDLILTELIPPLHVRKQKRLIALLREVKRFSIEVDWDDIVQTQILCINKGINGFGIPDLIIAQNAIQNDLYLLTKDKHFALISKHIPLPLYAE
jgi:predicted nucleic acid-binding protein